MQHRTIQSLQSESMHSQALGNYSRTPELRVSHKLAERKRRSEMKDLFEELNKAVPSNGGTKASKWEILTKGISELPTNVHHVLTVWQQSTTSEAPNTKSSASPPNSTACSKTPTTPAKLAGRTTCSKTNCRSCASSSNALIQMVHMCTATSRRS